MYSLGFIGSSRQLAGVWAWLVERYMMSDLRHKRIEAWQES